MKPKILAHYLPQFHDITENNEWRWEWFTERSNVKKAKPLFIGHDQPRVPLNKIYYNILDPKVRKWQSDLAKKYGIDGFCFYHYRFKGSKLLLEKPAELMLKDWYPDIDFCFSRWNWSRARTREGQPEQILMPQEYGDEEERENHFNYLLPFFKSPKYIHKDWKPVFVIHYSKHMKDVIDAMIHKRNTLCIKNNISWIYIIEAISSAQSESYSKLSSAIMEFQPLHSIKNVFSFGYIKNILIHLINRIWKKVFNKWLLINQVSFSQTRRIICNRNPRSNPLYKNKNIVLGWFTGRDNSPRKWRDSLIMNNGNPKTFKKYFNLLYKKALEKRSDFIFLNARNERAEWAYLEPDTLHSHWYLEAIHEVIQNNK